MLQSLHIVNFVIIEDVSFELDRGVSIFTGETGAGKSVLVDALAVLTGRRASVEDIRRGTPFFQIEGVFLRKVRKYGTGFWRTAGLNLMRELILF